MSIETVLLFNAFEKNKTYRICLPESKSKSKNQNITALYISQNMNLFYAAVQNDLKTIEIHSVNLDDFKHHTEPICSYTQ